jgi:hypothetical protein
MPKIVQLIAPENVLNTICVTDDGTIWLLKFEGGDPTKPARWVKSDWNNLPFVSPPAT